MNLSERYLHLVEKKYKPMVWEDINFGDVVWISTENWNIMWTGNRSLKRYPSDDYMKKLQPMFVNKTLGKVMDVYDNGSADVKFNDKTFRLKIEFLSKLEASEKKVQIEPTPITESIIDEPEQEETDSEYYNDMAKRDVKQLAKQFPEIGHNFHNLTYEESLCSVFTIRYAMIPGTSYLIGTEKRKLIVSMVHDYSPEYYRRITIGGEKIAILREVIDAIIGLGYNQFYDHKFNDGYIYFLKGTPSKCEKDWESLKGHLEESIIDEPEQEEESPSEQIDKYIHTETVVEIKTVEELEMLEMMVYPRLSFNRQSGRQRREALDDLKHRAKLYVNLKGAIMSSEETDGDALNIPQGIGYSSYKSRGYKILKFKGKKITEE